MRSFSLSTLLLTMVIVALVVSQTILIRQLRLARAEVNDVRRKYGYLHVTDKKKTYVAQIAENESSGDAYRLWIPKGSRYLLHLTDANFDTNDSPTNPTPTRSISLDDWNQGADTTLSCTIYWESTAPRIVVHTKSDKIFDYVLPNWSGGSGPSELTWFQPGGGQTEYSTDQNIQFMLWRNRTINRGILLWLEPYSNWEKRERQGETNAKEQMTVNPTKVTPNNSP
jgi:hypothetical protein